MRTVYRWEVTLLAVYVLHVVILTQVPFHHSLDELCTFSPRDALGIPRLDRWSVPVMIVVNLIMLMPIGALIAQLSGKRWSRAELWAVAALAGFGLSATVEMLQTCNYSRSVSLLDIQLNTAGCVLGSVLAPWFLGRLRGWSRRTIAALLFVAPAVYVAVIVLALRVESDRASFDSWDPRHFLAFGNEVEAERPWLGTLHYVAIYAAALDADEVAARARGAPDRDESRARSAAQQPLVEWTLRQPRKGIVASDPGSALPIRLAARSLAAREPSGAQGLHIGRPSRIVSFGPAVPLTRVLMDTNELSVEVWFRPDRLDQTGPARIVSLSTDAASRNFTLGQVGRDLEFRLRTGNTGVNGTRQALTAEGVLTGERQHVVVTYGDGIVRLFVDGQFAARTVLATPTLSALRVAGPVGRASFYLFVATFVALAGLASIPRLKRRFLMAVHSGAVAGT